MEITKLNHKSTLNISESKCHLKGQVLNWEDQL